MLAYSNSQLDILDIDNEAEKALRRKLITKEEYNLINGKYRPKVYNPNLFIRIGLFIASFIVVSMGFGLFSLFQFGYSDKGYAFMCLFFACLLYVALEYSIRKLNHYKSGVDDALLWMSAGYLFGSILLFFNIDSPIPLSVIILILALAATARFADAGAAIIMFVAFFSVIFNGLLLTGSIGRALLPFVAAAFAFIIYLGVKKFKGRHALRHYHVCLVVLEVLSLVTTYIALIYFVVRELSVVLLDMQLAPGASLTGGWFFWAATLMLPLIYIGYSLYRKDYVMLRVGILLVVATAFTVRAYYAITPIEVVLVGSGALVVVISYMISVFLKKPRYGITSNETAEAEMPEFMQIESLVVAETFKQVPGAQQPQGFQFGGGSSGGAGATGEY
jgi:hypothetical protein